MKANPHPTLTAQQDQQAALFGFLNLRKPSGPTSRDMVNQIQRIVRPLKVGHAGTLDPLASGVLVIALGRATRLIQYVQQPMKEYRATFRLGIQSDTEDIQGSMQPLHDRPLPSKQSILDTLPQLTGNIQQIPPAYSALKVKGQRAYQLARAGQAVRLQPREVRIDSIELINFDAPDFSLNIRCGSGTYIRSLGRDIARAVGSEAVMTRLERTAVGRFHIAQATPAEKLNDLDAIQRYVRPASEAVEHLPATSVSSAEAVELHHGRTIHRSSQVDTLIAVDQQGRLAAILTPCGDGRYRPARNFC